MFVADAYQLLCLVHHHCLLQTLLRGVVWGYVYALYLKVLLYLYVFKTFFIQPICTESYYVILVYIAIYFYSFCLTGYHEGKHL